MSSNESFRKGARCLTLLIFLLLVPAQSQQQPEPLPDTKEKVVDLFGGEARLYFLLPENILVFVDNTKTVSRAVVLGAQERHQLQTAYMKACDKAILTKDGQQDEGFSIWLRDTEIVFRTARRDNRSWVVLYVGDADAPARFAVPQVWDPKDPRMEQLYGIKSGFERLLIKSAL